MTRRKKIYTVEGRLKEHRDYERVVYVEATNANQAKNIATVKCKDTKFTKSSLLVNNKNELDPEEIKLFRGPIAIFEPEFYE